MIEVDNHKLMYHPERVSEWLRKGDCAPIYVEIGLTDYCNQKCVFCALDFLSHGKNFIAKDVMTSALEDMASSGVKSIMFAGEGEPLLHKNIGLFTQTAKKYGIDSSITTNGVLFSEKKIEQCLPNLSWIRFSIDSGTPENYAMIHGTRAKDFPRLIKNIENTVRFKTKNKLETTIGTQFLAIYQNIDEAVKLARILRDVGVDNLQIKPYSHHPKSSHQDLSVDSTQYNEIGEQLKEFSSDNFKITFREATSKRIEEGVSYPKCYGLPFITLIDSKANIIPCNLFYGKEKFTYGNLYEQSFSNIWEGDARRRVLERIDKLGTANCRKGCRPDPDNRYLHRLKNPEPHDNFI